MKKSRTELEEEIERLRPYQYLAWAMLKGDRGKVVRAGEDSESRRHAVKLFALGTPTGGLAVDGSQVFYADRYAAKLQRHPDPYQRALGNAIWREVVDAYKEPPTRP